MYRNADPKLAAELSKGDSAQRVDALFAYMEENGQSFYDEKVTQLQHALQAANQARQAGASSV